MAYTGCYIVIIFQLDGCYSQHLETKHEDGTKLLEPNCAVGPFRTLRETNKWIEEQKELIKDEYKIEFLISHIKSPKYARPR